MRPVLIAAVLVLAAACSPVCAPAATGPGTKLTFTGPAAGTLSGPTADCGSNAQQLNVHITGSLGGKSVDMNIQVNGYTGPKTYPVGSLLDGAGEVRLQVADANYDSTTGAGNVTVGSGDRSGSLKVDLIGGEHVEGTFGCDGTTAA